LVVTGLYPTATTIVASGTSAGSNYTLTSTVVGTGSIAFSPTPTVSFLDTSNGNASLGTATLGGSTFAQTFAPQLTSATLGDSNDVAVGDFNQDGLLDVVVLNYYASSLSVFLGAGDGTFGTPTQFPADFTCYSVVVGDFNGDGKLDLAVTNINAWTVSIYLGNGDGTFQSKQDYPVGGRPQGLAVGDFNRDGNLDLAVANASSASVSILLGDGLGGFAAQVTYPVGNSPTSVAVADFNGDGFPDLAVTNYSDGTQLDASPSVPGTPVYTPLAGTTPATGTDTLSVTYTPTDTTDYNNFTGTVNLTVNKATPTVSWTTPAAITFGTVLSATQLDASPSVPGTPVYTPLAGTTPAAGTDTLSVTYTPTDTTDYNTFSGTVNLTVNKATPTVSWTTPAAITFGTVLSATQLDASPSVPGTSVYSPAAGTIPAAGTDTLSVTFTPTDTTDYNNFSGTVQLTVNKVAPTITWTTPAAITYGAVLSGAQLDASAVPSGGTYVYTPALGSTPAAGRDTLSVTYTPPDTTDYSNATGTVTLAVNQAAPVITWATPAAIPYGTVLSATQLDASAVPSGGTYVYTPALGSIPAMGSDTLSVTYTPPDTTDYTTATATVNLTVTANSSPITPTISWATPAAVASGTALSSAQLNAIASVAGITVDGTFVYTPAAGTIPAIGLDTLTVVFTPTDSVDYATATGSVVLTVGDFFSLNFGSSPIQTVQQGANASYSFTVTPVGLAKLPGVVTFTATGLPPDATITFSPSTVPAGSAATEVAITIHTSSAQAANTGSSQGSKGPAALGMLLLPILGIVGLRKRLGKIPQLRAAVVLGVLSLGAIMGLTGCGAICTIGPQPTSTTYTVVITAHCGALQHSADVTIKVEN